MCLRICQWRVSCIFWNIYYHLRRILSSERSIASILAFLIGASHAFFETSVISVASILASILSLIHTSIKTAKTSSRHYTFAKVEPRSMNIWDIEPPSKSVIWAVNPGTAALLKTIPTSASEGTFFVHRTTIAIHSFWAVFHEKLRNIAQST